MKRRESERSSIAVRLLALGVALIALLTRRPSRRLPTGVDPEDLAAGYERSDMSPTAVLAAAIALLVMLAIVLVLVTSLEVALTGIPVTLSRPPDLTSGLQAASAPTPPSPRLEAQSGELFEPYRAAEESKLSSYRWVDRSAGVASMPIDRAMELIVQRGLPSRATPPAAARDSGNLSPSSASAGRVEEAYP